MLSYLLASADKKTQMLFDLATRDQVFASLIHTLNKTGHTIKHTYWGRPGIYIPQSDKTAVPKFRFSYRYGYSIIAHTFLHELIHYKQDQEGRLPSPQTAEDQNHYIEQILNCEAEAQTEAIAASWRLKQAGHPQAWHGALHSFDWRTLTKAYQKDMETGLTEEKSYANCLENWYKTPQRHYYEQRAKTLFQKHLSK